MQFEPQFEPRQPCEVCGASVHELRRGRCWGCYSRWVERRPVGLGARCITCGERRMRVLSTVELFGGWKPMCFNCAGQMASLDEMPPSLAALRDAVSRERRRVDRRVGHPDTRVYQYERRVGDRRSASEGREYEHIDDDMIIEVSIDPSIEGLEIDFGELTQIRELVDLRGDRHADRAAQGVLQMSAELAG